MLSNRVFEEDPFFAGHREYMRQFQEMFRVPFGMHPMGTGGMLGLQAGPGASQQRSQVVPRQTQSMMPADMFGFGAFGGMFQNMRRMMDEMNSTFENAQNNPNSQVFSQSSFMSYSSAGGPGNAPKVYQSSSSTTCLPGGIKETRKMVRDSESGLEKMAVGHHIRDRGHVVERQRNRRTGMQEENQEYINLDEDEVSEFDQEWLRQSRQMYGPNHNHRARLNQQQRLQRQERSNRRALPAATSQRHSHRHNPTTYRDRE